MISTFADDATGTLLSLLLLQNDQDAKKIGESNFLTWVYIRNSGKNVFTHYLIPFVFQLALLVQLSISQADSTKLQIVLKHNDVPFGESQSISLIYYL